jgi:hypothetical protein
MMTKPLLRIAHDRDGLLDILLHHSCFQPQDTIAGAMQLAIAPRVRAQATRVTFAIDLDDEAHRRCDKINDEPPNDNLPLKRNPKLLAAQPRPKQRFRARSHRAHLRRPLREDLSRVRGDGSHCDTSHTNLLGTGIGPDAPPSPQDP